MDYKPARLEALEYCNGNLVAMAVPRLECDLLF
jgi:hypothetical protein